MRFTLEFAAQRLATPAYAKLKRKMFYKRNLLFSQLKNLNRHDFAQIAFFSSFRLPP